MGPTLSPVLANLFMEFFESERLRFISLRSSSLFPGPLTCPVPGFLGGAELSFSIPFKVEWEADNKLPFLDTAIRRSAFGIKFLFMITPFFSCQLCLILRLHLLIYERYFLKAVSFLFLL